MKNIITTSHLVTLYSYDKNLSFKWDNIYNKNKYNL